MFNIKIVYLPASNLINIVVGFQKDNRAKAEILISEKCPSGICSGSLCNRPEEFPLERHAFLCEHNIQVAGWDVLHC